MSRDGCLHDLPSASKLFGVLDAPSPNNSAGLVCGGVCTRDDDVDLRADIGADIVGRRELTKLSGRPSSESLSSVPPERDDKRRKINEFSF